MDSPTRGRGYLQSRKPAPGFRTNRIDDLAGDVDGLMKSLARLLSVYEVDCVIRRPMLRQLCSTTVREHVEVLVVLGR